VIVAQQAFFLPKPFFLCEESPPPGPYFPPGASVSPNPFSTSLYFVLKSTSVSFFQVCKNLWVPVFSQFLEFPSFPLSSSTVRLFEFRFPGRRLLRPPFVHLFVRATRSELLFIGTPRSLLIPRAPGPFLPKNRFFPLCPKLFFSL